MALKSPELKFAVEGIKEELPSKYEEVTQLKIIKTAELTIEVKDFRKASQRVREITENLGGFVSETREEVERGEYRSGMVIIRVPVNRFNEAIEKIEKIGKVEHSHIKGEDVTKQYIDLQARLENQEAVKKRFLTILEKAKVMDDIIKIEKELVRIGEEIERLQGEIRYLENRIELATISVNMHEPKAIIPYTLGIGKIFKDAFRQGMENCIHLTAFLIMCVETLFPLICLGIIILIIRSYWKKRRKIG
jgi:uncharacterized protein YeeX (DUF496 family)